MSKNTKYSANLVASHCNKKYWLFKGVWERLFTLESPNMRSFYLNYPEFIKCQSLTGKLTRTHYCELLSISDAGYALGGLSNQIFASKYVLQMPDKEQLIAQVESVINKWNEDKF